MQPDLSLSPRQAWLAGLGGGALAGLADAGHLVVAGRIGLGLPGIIALAALGLVVGAATGGLIGGAVAAAARWRVRPHVPFVLGAASTATLRVSLGAFLAQGDSLLGPAGTAAAVGVGGVALATLLIRGVGRLRYGPHGLVATTVTVAGVVGLTGGPALVPSKVPSVDRPNVLLVTFGGARLDRFGLNPLDTPGFDRVAAEGTNFRLAVTPSADEHTAAVALLTGREPWVTAEPPPEGLAAAVMAEAVNTAAFVSTDRFNADGQLDAGFQVYDDDHDWPKGVGRTLTGMILRALDVSETAHGRRADEVVDRAIRYVHGQPGQWFVWVHLDDPMPPWEPPIPYDERYYRGADPKNPAAITLAEGTRMDPVHGDTLEGVRDADWPTARYDGEVAYADAALARLLREIDTMGRAPNTLVIVTSLGGMALRESDPWFSPEPLVDETVHVPLAMRLPSRVPVAHGVGLPVSLADIAPTVAELLGVHGALEGASGVSLRPTMEGTGVARRSARSIGSGAVHPVAVRVPGALVVHDPRGPLRAWRFADEDRGTDAWTPERVLDLLAWAVELDGSGAAAPTMIDARSQVVLDALAPRVDPNAGVAE